MKKANLVFLNCCETADGILYAAELVGLTHAFLKAGAKQVVAYRGLLSDELAPDFVQAFYEEYSLSFEADTALKAAQIRMIEKGIDEDFWSGYSVIRQRIC